MIVTTTDNLKLIDTAKFKKFNVTTSVEIDV